MNTARALKSFLVTGTGAVLKAGWSGVYYLPKVMVRKMTVRKSCTLDAVIWNKTIVISGKPQNRKEMESVHVDAKGNLRIPEKLVKKAKIALTVNDPYLVAIQDSTGDIIVS